MEARNTWQEETIWEIWEQPTSETLLIYGEGVLVPLLITLPLFAPFFHISIKITHVCLFSCLFELYTFARLVPISSSLDSVVGIATGYGLDDRGVRV
jgi:hypothetical protein